MGIHQGFTERRRDLIDTKKGEPSALLFCLVSAELSELLFPLLGDNLVLTRLLATVLFENQIF